MADEEIAIPTYIELMQPTLQALNDLGGEGSNGSIEAKVIELSALSARQLAIEFDSDQSNTGSKILYRALSLLHRSSAAISGALTAFIPQNSRSTAPIDG